MLWEPRCQTIGSIAVFTKFTGNSGQNTFDVAGNFHLRIYRLYLAVFPNDERAAFDTHVLPSIETFLFINPIACAHTSVFIGQQGKWQLVFIRKPFVRF